MTRAEPQRIDCHCHVGLGLRKKQEAEKLIKAMDALEIGVSVVCPVDEHIAVSNVEGNNEILEVTKKHRGRLWGMAVANPWWGSKAIEELKRALGEGLKGLKINPSLQGHWANDEMLDPLIDLVQLHGGHAYVHSGTPDFSLPFEVCDLAMRHPGVDFIMGHSGFVDVFWNQAVYSAIRPGLTNIYYDTSHISFVGEIRDAVRKIGAQRFVFGSDSPAGSLGLELYKIGLLGLSKEEESMILRGNMAKILKL